MAHTFKASALVKTLVPNPPPLPCLKGVPFGTLFTPHMFQVESKNDVWGTPRIVPFANLSLPPQAGGLHYGLQCFEGLKVYKSQPAAGTVHMSGTSNIESGAAKQHLLLFRPEMNVRRLQRSMDRLCFPSFDENECLQIIKEFVKVERDYVPNERGFSLYLRPSAIANNVTLSAVPSDSTLLYIIASPVGPYFSQGMKPVKLHVEEFHKRAWRGGVGEVKLGANYAAPMKIQKQIAAEAVTHKIMKPNPLTGAMECVGEEKVKLQQVLWLGSNNEVQEVGAMNFMCLWKNKQTGRRELRTAPLDGCVLPGITRNSVLSLARHWGEFDVTEEAYTIHELVEAIEEHRVEELFGCGTAAIVCPVDGLSFRGHLYDVPCPEKSVTKRFLDAIENIQYGMVEHEWIYVVE